MSESVFTDLKCAKQQNYQLIYEREGVLGNASNVVEDMFEMLYTRLLDDLMHADESSPVYRHHVANLVAKSRTISADEYLAQDPNLIVVDYLASMTDSYFMALFAQLFPTSKLHVITRDYCVDLA